MLREVPGAGRVLSQVGHEVDLAARDRGGALGGAEVQAERIRSGYPAGWAAAYHSRKCGLRTRSNSRPGRYRLIRYGPVAGSGVWAWRPGVAAGRTSA